MMNWWKFMLIKSFGFFFMLLMGKFIFILIMKCLILSLWLWIRKNWVLSIG